MTWPCASSSAADKSSRQLPWLLAGVGGLILLASATLPLSLISRIHLCAFRNLTGYPCPFCGLTRAFLAMAHGDVTGAWHIMPLGVPLFVSTVAIFVWSAVALFLRRQLPPALPWRWIMPLGAILLLVNWIYRLAAGLK
ncbi:MAG: DUF2752 domain-containing protein [Verrucomicrobia bacterium]|nr:MAG: DUF2752 domain-containing protein [Verrucomicrobiota bacterium]